MRDLSATMPTGLVGVAVDLPPLSEAEALRTRTMMMDVSYAANAAVAVLAAFGILAGCWLFSEWARGTFKEPRGQKLPDEPYRSSRSMAEYVEPDHSRDEARAEAELEAMIRVEARKLVDSQPERESPPPAETGLQAATTLPDPPEASEDPREAARAHARAEAARRIAERATGQAAEELEAEANAARMQAEIQRRAAKARQERSRPRPGVRSVKDYDFEKELRDDIPRSQMVVDPLDILPGYR